MVSKLGTGRATTLICSDCGLTQKPASTVIRPNPFGQLVSALLMSLFALTAIGLMAIKDQQSPSLLDDEQIERNQRTQRAEAPIPGRVTWSGHIGKFVFEPEDPSLGDFLAGGVAVKLSITT
jgi:hypothetical protein